MFSLVYSTLSAWRSGMFASVRSLWSGFFLNNSYVQMICELCAQFSLHPRDAVPTQPTIKRWIENFQETASISKKKPLGQPATTPYEFKREVWGNGTVGLSPGSQWDPPRAQKKIELFKNDRLITIRILIIREEDYMFEAIVSFFPPFDGKLHKCYE